MEQNTNDEIEIDLLELFHLIRARIWIIILSGILTAVCAGLISSFLLTPIYTSTTKLYILNKSTSLTSLALQDLQLGTQLTQDYMVLVKSRPVVTQVIDNLELNMTYEDMLNVITIDNPANTRILEITADYPDPYLAKRIVDEFATVSTTRIAKIMDTSQPTVVEEGYLQPNPSSPNIKKNTIIGALIGILLSGGIIVVLYLLDDTIKDSEDIEKYLGLHTLGLIPIETGAQKQMELDKRKRRRQLKKGNRKKAGRG
ncbi:YveK family protein [Anaerocolumna chitinilytica]|uniref:Chain-length determining protein n=1 Tax=Anaerocolumna chitinilytica TaxID=1727145 RepID=A0A7I8DG32_9FIRM|nr:Wzz/FepE/Etk N-terminal domain-containing protein [Anaerocolumna chitinilytica]BCJ97352.1 chain-length determining protein [Anaerocolumna chitinilytica]